MQESWICLCIWSVFFPVNGLKVGIYGFHPLDLGCKVNIPTTLKRLPVYFRKVFMLLQFTSSVQRDIIFLFLAELIWFNLYSIFILQPALVAYLIVYITDMASGSATATLHYNLTIGLSLLCPSCTLTCSLYYIARVRLPFVLFDLLNGIFLWLRLRFFGLVAHFFLNISALKKTHVIKLGET